MTPELLFVGVIILFAFAFDFLNGMNDAANSIATVVSTRVLKPRWAVAWAAFFNLAAAFTFGTHVAKTMGKGIVHVDVLDNWLILSTLLGAILWTYVCTHYGMPISVSHALIGGLMGSGLAKAGIGSLVVGGIVKVAFFIVLAPLIGMLLGAALMILTSWVCRRQPPYRVDKTFRALQLLSSAAYSLSHGSNDAQKTMGIIMGLLIANGFMAQTDDIPLWIVITCYLFISLGTLIGGWRVIRTLGIRVTKLQPPSGFCAETGGAMSVLLATHLGIPVSTTHTIAGSIMGVGSTRRLSAVRWGVARRIVVAWILTIPCTAVVAAACYHLTAAFH